MDTAGEEVAASLQTPTMEALVAATLALMTGHASQSNEGLRALMARKIVSNLFFLASHPQASPALRGSVMNIRQQWTQQIPTAAAPTQVACALWHGAHEVVQ